MIYFDNAATGGFKPYSVIEQTVSTVKYLCANPGRSGHRLSVAAANLVYKARTELSSLFNATPERVIFTKNCTEALNTAIFGIKKGAHIVSTVTEHNSVLRPLNRLKEDGVNVTYAAPCPDLESAVLNAVKKDTYLVAVNNVSNVTGKETDVRKIGKGLKEINPDIVFLVDGAQSAGHLPIDMKDSCIDVLCVAGHKGLYGSMGSGALIFNENTEISPLLYGGTGVESFNELMPDFYPERLEAGTLSLPSIVSLLEGALYVKKNVETFGLLLYDMSKLMIEELSAFERIKLYSEPNRSGIVSFTVEGFSSEEFADVLSQKYDIAVRGGFQCAPLMHKFLGTDKEGLIRVSLAPQNTVKEIRAFILAVAEIVCS